MKLIIPVKAPAGAKQRLSSILNEDQRAKLCRLMLEDVLQAVRQSGLSSATLVVSSDPSVKDLADTYKVDFLLTTEDRGYSEDALLAVEQISSNEMEAVAIIPADVPQLSGSDLSSLVEEHQPGITLCPAIADGGTNALVFDLPRTIPLVFGIDSLVKYQQEAARKAIKARVSRLPGLERDIDTPGDIQWLRQQEKGGKAWAYVRGLSLEYGEKS